jgi:hypothetical protein
MPPIRLIGVTSAPCTYYSGDLGTKKLEGKLRMVDRISIQTIETDNSSQHYKPFACSIPNQVLSSGMYCDTYQFQVL